MISRNRKVLPLSANLHGEDDGIQLLSRLPNQRRADRRSNGEDHLGEHFRHRVKWQVSRVAPHGMFRENLIQPFRMKQPFDETSRHDARRTLFNKCLKPRVEQHPCRLSY
ncbi:MAG: hypothetical protein ACKV2Q_00420 [Planctomycetaceae bacterium]